MTHKVVGITVGIGVKDIKEATDWYQSLLGGVETMEPAPGVIELKLTDDSWLQLDDSGYLEIGGGSSVLRLETNDIESAHQQAKKLASDVNEIETVEGVVKYFDFKDPAGNKLSYVQLL